MTTAVAMNWEDMEWKEVRPGIKRKVFHCEGCTIVCNAIEPGHEPKPHSHAREGVKPKLLTKRFPFCILASWLDRFA